MSREQQWLLPPSLDELVPADHPARFVAEFIDALDRDGWAAMGIDLAGGLGAPAYHPRALLSVWVYGFMTGGRSIRKLEAACREQLPYLWLTGGACARRCGRPSTRCRAPVLAACARLGQRVAMMEAQARAL